MLFSFEEVERRTFVVCPGGDQAVKTLPHPMRLRSARGAALFGENKSGEISRGCRDHDKLRRLALHCNIRPKPTLALA
jgi:hypothetical protein